jgi:hypothetical protein
VTLDRSTLDGVQTCGVHLRTDLGSALDLLGIMRNRPVIILIGGAADMTNPQSSVAEVAVRDGVGPVAAELGAVVVDGGTNAGVMELAGRIRSEQGDRFALVGVVGRRLVVGGEDPSAPIVALEPRHTGIVLVPGSNWGDETPWLFDVAELIAADRPIRTVMVNGGAITRTELAESVRRGIPVIVIRGTGRAADDLDGDNVLDGPNASYDRSLISVVEAAETDGLRSMLRDALGGDGDSGTAGSRSGEGSEDGAGS